MEYPAPYAGHVRRDARRARRQQDHHADQSRTTTGSSRARSPASSSRSMHELLLGEHDFYDEIFTSLRIPYEPVRWVRDVARDLRGPDRQGRPGHRADPRVPGARPPDGRHRPARVQDPQAPRPRRTPARPDPVGPRPHLPGRRLRRQAEDEAARDPRRAARHLLPPGRHRVHAHPGPGGAALDPGADRAQVHQARRRTSRSTCSTGSTRPRRSRPSCRPSTSARSASRWRAASR